MMTIWVTTMIFVSRPPVSEAITTNVHYFQVSTKMKNSVCQTEFFFPAQPMWLSPEHASDMI